jgi:hypothetical protein
MIGYGDTSSQTVYYAEIWNNGRVEVVDFKEAIKKWWDYAYVKR